MLAAALSAGALALPVGAQAASGVQHLHYRFGPLTITPGTNVNTVGPISEKPNVDGYISVCLIIGSIMVTLGSLLSDLLYAWADPRLRSH